MKALVALVLAILLAVAVAQPTDPTMPNPSLPTQPTSPDPVPPTSPDPVPPTSPNPVTPITPTDPSLPAPTPAPTNPVEPAPPTPTQQPTAPAQPLKPVPAPQPAKPAAPKPAPKPVAKPAPKPAPKLVPLELRLETTEQEIRDGQLREVLIVRKFAVPNKSTALSRQNKKPSAGLENIMQSAYRSLYRGSKDAVWVREGSNWIATQQSAWRVDERTSRAYVLEALKFNKPSARIVVQRSRPVRNVQDWHAKGIRYHFGGGESRFVGSSSFRVTNIIAGARQIDNITIAAGGIFNFNRDVKISKELGFVDGYIIKGGILEKDIGGGICQVSTTVWRAAYNAGLPILQRNYHSYRVAYYDPPGFEATVFAPYKNLIFRNDTGAPLFVQVTWYTRSARLEMHFFGAKPDRRVDISRGYVSNLRQPPAPRFVADPEVRLGRAKRLSGAERGMNVRIDRVVRYNTGRVARDSTFSSYVPWGELWAVNPQDARVQNTVPVASTSSLPVNTSTDTLSAIVAPLVPSLSKPAAGGAPER
jgi:vancomycin resistance protein YoaR